jgi:hypothetical protein
VIPVGLTGERYCNSPENLLPVLREDAPVTLRHMLWFLHGGALPLCEEDANRE